jgi:hypothetical protein
VAKPRRAWWAVGSFLGLVGLVLATAAQSPSAAPAPCSLVPQLRDVTINQGLGSYPTLVRGKETLVRYYLSLPACHDSNDSIELRSATFAARRGATPIATSDAPVPPLVTPYPTLSRYATAPAPNAPADPIFIVPASTLAPADTTDRYTVTFSTTIGYRSRTGGGATPVDGSVTLSKFPGTADDIAKVVETRTKAIRLLVVPMGDAAQSYDSQFNAAARDELARGMQGLSRLYPVPAGIGSLTNAAGGVRYTLGSTLLEAGDLMRLSADGKLCLSGGSFYYLEERLDVFLQAWNSANPSTPADVVVGAVDERISGGSESGCAEGYASLYSPHAVFRVYTATRPSKTATVLAHEVGHTLGLVPPPRGSAGHHSVNTAADGTSPNRGYDIPRRRYIADDRTVMRLSIGAWNDDTTLLEMEDWALVHCRLGGPTNSECGVSGDVGTSAGVPAWFLRSPRFYALQTRLSTTPVHDHPHGDFFAHAHSP